MSEEVVMSRILSSGLEAGLRPRSMAVVGVSEDPHKYGTRMARSIVEAGFEGSLYFVNPKPGKYLGHRFVASLSDVEEKLDLAILSVPSAVCSSVISEAGSLEIPLCVVVATGFSEVGKIELQAELIDAARTSGTRVIGPNSMGILSHPVDLNAMGDATIPKGRVAVVAQSGNVGVSIYHSAKRFDLGLSYFISLGNQADVTFDEVIDFLAKDDSTDVVLLYVEGFKNLRAFLESASALRRIKPVAILRGGTSNAGARAAASHTGSIAGDDRVVASGLDAAGLIEVDSTEDLLLAALALTRMPRLRGRRVSIVSDSGGYATLAADAATRAGLEVEPHPDDLQAVLKSFLEPQASVTNPIDMIGGVDVRSNIYQDVIGACAESAHSDGLMVVGAFCGYGFFGGPTLSEYEAAAAKDMVEISERSCKPLVVQTIYADQPHEGIKTLRKAGVPVVERLDDAMRIMAIKAAFNEKGDRIRANWSISTASCADERVLTEDESRAWLSERAPGLIGPPRVVATGDEALEAFARMRGTPMVLKILSDKAIHKSDVGGVHLDLRTEEEVRAAWKLIQKTAMTLGTEASALVTPYEVGGIEALVGMYRHKSLGPVVMVGWGGVFAEALSDVAVLFPPVTTNDVERAMADLAIGRVLHSPRAGEGVVDALASVAQEVGRLALEEAELLELDLNPVLLRRSSYQVLDVRVVIA